MIGYAKTIDEEMPEHSNRAPVAAQLESRYIQVTIPVLEEKQQRSQAMLLEPTGITAWHFRMIGGGAVVGAAAVGVVSFFLSVPTSDSVGLIGAIAGAVLAASYTKIARLSSN